MGQDMVHDTADDETRLKALGGSGLFVGALEGGRCEGLCGAV